MEKEKFSEAALAAKFIEYFEGWDIYPEVPVPQSGRICDIVMKMGKLIVAVEVKASFNITVLYQALHNQKFAHFSYIAIPAPKCDNTEGILLCEHLGIGLLYYNPKSVYTVHALYKYWQSGKSHYSNVKEKVEAAYKRPGLPITLKDWMKRSIAGSQSERLTDFKILMEEIAEAITRGGGKVLAKDFFAKNKYHYASTASARYSIKSYCESGKIKVFRYENGYLTTLPETVEPKQQNLLCE